MTNNDSPQNMSKEEVKKAKIEAERSDLVEILKTKTPEEAAELFNDFVKFALNQKFEGIVLELYQGISKIRILEGVLPADPKICEFHIKMTIDGKIESRILRVPAEKMSSPKFFKDQYFCEFKRLIIIKNKNWHELINALMKERSETVKCLEESEDVMTAREIFSEIRDLKVTNDKKQFLAANNSQFLFNPTFRRCTHM